jgi:hypothetical protein
MNIEIPGFVKVAQIRGVNVYIEFCEIAGSSFEVLESGETKDVIPQYDVYYTYAGSARYDSFNEIVEAIDHCFLTISESCDDHCDLEFAEVMNAST